MKYDDGIIVNHDRPLNPRTKKVRLQDLAQKPLDGEKKDVTRGLQFKDFENKLVNTETMKKLSGSNIKGFIDFFQYF